MKKIVLSAALFLTVLLTARSATILSDSFNYSNGSLVTISGGQWTTYSGTTGQVNVTSGRLNLSQSNTEDVHALLQGQPYSSTSSAVLYASFTINYASLPSISGSYFGEFKDGSTTSLRDRIFATTSNAPSGFFRVGISNASNSPSATITTNLTLNTDYTLVVRYVVNTATSTLWLSPVTEADASVTASDTATTISVTSFGFREDGSSGTIGNFFVDNLLVGTSFADVAQNTNASPSITLQPQSQSVLEGSTATFSVAASGSSPLSYQWQFNGTNLVGATSVTLTLTNVTTMNSGSYSVVVSNAIGSTTSGTATLTVTQPTPFALSLLTYNVKGNGATNWSTNTLQVQAIGREVIYLNPDIITFNEIPYTNTYEMTNFIKAFLPGYSLATNSGTDGFIRSAIASRYPITRSKSWLDGADLNPFGYTNSNFTRDLFEAQITVPGFTQPVHVFTTHLKSSISGYTDAAANALPKPLLLLIFWQQTFSFSIRTILTFLLAT